MTPPSARPGLQARVADRQPDAAEPQTVGLEEPPRLSTIKVTGHRGAMALALENSALSLLTAEQHGADELEIDIRLSADDVAVVVHDTSLARICGDPGLDAKLRALDWREIEAVELPDGQRVLNLEQVLDLTTAHLQVEIKESDAVAVVAAELDRRPDDRQRCLIASFSIDILRQVQIHIPDVPRGLIVNRYSHEAADHAHSVRAEWLLSGWHGLDAETVDTLAASGVSVGGWPLRDAADAALATELGVAGITADDPGAARRWLDQVAAPG